MGAWQSTPANETLQPSNLPPPRSPPHPSRSKPLLHPDRNPPPPSSPPHPSRSELTPKRPRPRNALSYFLSAPTSDLIHSHYNPTINDIDKTIQFLANRLPPELVSRVIDESRYWAGCRNLLKKEIEVVSAQPGMRRLPRASGWKTGQEEGIQLVDQIGQIWYLLSEEVGCESSESVPTESAAAGPDVGGPKLGVKEAREDEGPKDEEAEKKDLEGCWLREIVIETLSKDQGWSSAVNANPALYGTYDASYSWFEISILRNGTEIEGTRRSILNNVHAGQYYKAHRVVLGSEDDFVKQVRKGDRVILWVRAQYPGWRNLVREAAITLYWAPFPQA